MIEFIRIRPHSENQRALIQVIATRTTVANTVLHSCNEQYVNTVKSHGLFCMSAVLIAILWNVYWMYVIVKSSHFQWPIMTEGKNEGYCVRKCNNQSYEAADLSALIINCLPV